MIKSPPGLALLAVDGLNDPPYRVADIKLRLSPSSVGKAGAYLCQFSPTPQSMAG